MGVPQSSSIFRWIFHEINHPFGVPPFINTPTRLLSPAAVHLGGEDLSTHLHDIVPSLRPWAKQR